MNLGGGGLMPNGLLLADPACQGLWSGCQCVQAGESKRIMTGKIAHTALRGAGGVRGSGQLLVDEGGELCLAHGADLGGGELAVLE